jgi:hypothetical protein
MRTNYARLRHRLRDDEEPVTVQRKQHESLYLANPSHCTGEASQMLLGQDTCMEDERDLVKRTNRAMQIAKDFAENKLQAVLNSNKETQKVVHKRHGCPLSLTLSIILSILFVVTPLVLIALEYLGVSNLIETSKLRIIYMSYITRYAGESAETYNSYQLLALIREYSSVSTQ